MISEPATTNTSVLLPLLTMTNTSEVKVDLTSFAKNFLAEALMMNGDFPLSSQYFYKDPDGTLYSGPRWDFDYLSWRFADTETWDAKTNYGAKHAKFWEHLGKHTDFIKLLNDIRVKPPPSTTTRPKKSSQREKHSSRQDTLTGTSQGGTDMETELCPTRKTSTWSKHESKTTGPSSSNTSRTLSTREQRT